MCSPLASEFSFPLLGECCAIELSVRYSEYAVLALVRGHRKRGKRTNDLSFVSFRFALLRSETKPQTKQTPCEVSFWYFRVPRALYRVWPKPEPIDIERQRVLSSRTATWRGIAFGCRPGSLRELRLRCRAVGRAMCSRTGAPSLSVNRTNIKCRRKLLSGLRRASIRIVRCLLTMMCRRKCRQGHPCIPPGHRIPSHRRLTMGAANVFVSLQLLSQMLRPSMAWLKSWTTSTARSMGAMKWGTFLDRLSRKLRKPSVRSQVLGTCGFSSVNVFL